LNIQELATVLDNGLSSRELREKYGVTKAEIMAALDYKLDMERNERAIIPLPEDDIIREMLKEKYMWKEIAEAVGWPLIRVTRRADKLGLKKTRGTRQQVMEMKMIKGMLQQGMGIKEIAKQIQRHPETVRDRIRMMEAQG